MGLIIEIIFLIIVAIIFLANLYFISLSKKLRSINNETELSGFEIAKKISEKVSNKEPHIIKKKGKFLDHYNINRNVIKLSPEVFDGVDLYAAFVAFNTALETDKEKEKAPKGHNLSSFIVMSSYIMIILGTLLNNSSIMHFGFILFIIAFILEILILNIFGKTLEDIERIYKFVEKNKIIKPFDEYKKYIVFLQLSNIVNLPYRFINNIR